MYTRRNIGEILLDHEVISRDTLNQALEKQGQQDRDDHLTKILVDMEAISQSQAYRALAEQMDYPFKEQLDDEAIDLSLLEELELGFCRDKRVLPFEQNGDQVYVGTDKPLALDNLDEIGFITGLDVSPVIVPPAELTDAINEAFDRKSRQLDEGFEDLEEAEAHEADEEGLDMNDLLDASSDEEAPVIRFVNNLFVQAVRERASDIHIEPEEDELTVRFRIDGVLKEVYEPPKRFHSSIITRIKIMAGLDIAEKRLPQDGRIRIKMAGRDIDVRVATAPAVHGERITMRLLDKSAQILNIRDIGLAKDYQEKMLDLIHRPNGIILVTGPTGSGKTTTLYSSLSEINHPDINILTVEDPVEFQLEGISQMQVNPKINLDFAKGLRSYLRHDPDVIMVGEIRDLETAEMAIQASLTGHLVFSTLHTNDAPSAFTRLIDMGVEPFLVASTVLSTMAQRLVRRLGPECKVSYMPTENVLEDLKLTKRDIQERTEEGHIYRASEDGCEECLQLGYKGRTSIFEILEVTDGVRQLVMDNQAASKIKKEARSNAGMRTLREDGALKVLNGVTSIEEVLRVTQEDTSSEIIEA
jgi:general secretion pathway protein E